jgi:predicted RNase H-like nuclease
LVVSGKLQGVSMFPEPPQVMATITDLLDTRPPWDFVALHCPIGLPRDTTPGGRRCDREARKLLGPNRGAAVISPPPRSVLDAEHPEGLSVAMRWLLPRIKDVHYQVASYHQKTVFEVHPELGFYQLNGDQPLKHRKATAAGIEERVALLEARMPGFERIVGNRPAGVSLPILLDGAADLWTARRIAARAIARLPETPEWNEDGLKMELVR